MDSCQRVDQGKLVLRLQGVEAASGGRDGSGLQDAVVIVPSGTADGAGPADGSMDGLAPLLHCCWVLPDIKGRQALQIAVNPKSTSN